MNRHKLNRHKRRQLLEGARLDGERAFLPPDNSPRSVWLSAVRLDIDLWGRGKAGERPKQELVVDEQHGMVIVRECAASETLYKATLPDVDTPEELLAWIRAWVRVQGGAHGVQNK